MKRRTLSYMLLAILITAAYFALKALARLSLPTPSAYKPKAAEQIEAALALNQRVALSQMSPDQLELLTGVGSTLSNRVLADFNKIKAACQQEEPQKALQIVKGIGNKKAAMIAKFIDVCD